MRFLHLYLLCILASAALYGMNPVDPEHDTPFYTFSELESNTPTEQPSIVNYSECVINETTGEAYGIEYTNDGTNETIDLYHVYGNDHSPEPETSAGPEENSEVTSERDGIWDSPDGRMETLGDAVARDREYAERWRREESSEEEDVEKLPTRKKTVIKLYSTKPCSSIMRQNLASPKVRETLKAIKQDLESKTCKSNQQRKQIAFITMALDGSLVEKIKLVEEGSYSKAEAIYQELRDAWPWAHKVSFMERFVDTDEEAALIHALGVDVINEVERTLIARKDYQKAHNIDLSFFIGQCRQKQMRGDLEGLGREHTQLCRELLNKNVPQNTLHLRCRIVTLRLFMADPVTIIFHTIATHVPEMARKQVMDLTRQLGEFYSKNGIQPLSEVSADMVERYGHDLITRARICYESRPDYKPEMGSVSSISWEIIITNIAQGPLPVAQREFNHLEQQIHEHCAANNITPEQQQDYLIKAVGIDLVAQARDTLKSRPDYQPEPAAPPLTTTDLPATGAQTTATMPTATSSSSVPVTDANASSSTASSATQSPATSDLPATGANTSSASSYTADSTTASSSSTQPQQQEGSRSLRIPEVPREMRSARRLLLEALGQATGQVQLADRIDGVRREVFDLAHQRNYEIHPEVQERVYTSIRVIRVTQHEHELVFNLAAVDRLLSDIQSQAAPDIAAQQTLLERSPELLVHGLKTFVSGLNPIAQIKGLCELLVDTAHFACDMTVGKLYLSPQEYQARKDGFWATMDALSPENLAQLSAENWVELAANMAAGVVVAGGIYKTVTYLKEIEATSRAVRQAAKIAGALKGAVDTVLAEHPIAVTAGGMLLRMQDKVEEIEDKVVEVARNSGQLLQCAARAADGIARRLQPLGLGPSRDARIIAENLHEQLVMEEAMSNPLIGRILELGKGMTDPRWPQIDGWVKMSWRSHNIEIHYVAQWVNGVMKAVDDFKFKDAIKKVL